MPEDPMIESASGLPEGGEQPGIPAAPAADPAGPGPEFRAAIEAIVYAAEEPVTVQQIASAVHGERDAVRRALRELIAAYETDERGIGIREVAGGYKFYTKPQHHEAVRRFIKSLQPPLRLSMPALETLAVIAYKQPVTLPEIQEIRGVQAAGVIKTLLERGMITTAGRKEALGRPILYRTTKDFLMRFGLAGVEDLPSLKEFEALARAALGEDGIIPEEPGEVAEAAAGTSEAGAELESEPGEGAR
ncbi:MAG TPA: SMC-Scp complex subunit ScpB [Patescibacteria group bacterium]|nr:SMC-Scp complex subunit ScpB [Patescibacteria group bacterium]